MIDLMQYYPPINLYDEKLRRYAEKLGTAWIRVSVSWATKTYYDFDGITGGKAPEGYASVLTKEQWIGVLDFVKAVGGKLLMFAALGALYALSLDQKPRTKHILPGMIAALFSWMLISVGFSFYVENVANHSII